MNQVSSYLTHQMVGGYDRHMLAVVRFPGFTHYQNNHSAFSVGKHQFTTQTAFPAGKEPLTR